MKRKTKQGRKATEPRYAPNSSQVRHEERLHWVDDRLTGETYGAKTKREAEKLARWLNETVICR